MYYKIPSYKMPQRDKLQEMKFSAEKRETREGEVDWQWVHSFRAKNAKASS